MSINFNYEQLLNIVKSYININHILSPSDILKKYELQIEEQKIDAEHKKIDIINTLVNNGNTLTEITQVFNSISNISEFNNNEVIKNKEICNEDMNYNNQSINVNNDVKILTKNDLIRKINSKQRKPMGKRIQKINPDNLDNIIKTYDSLCYLLRSPECIDMNSSSLRDAIKKHKKYKGFRWIYEGDEILPTIKSIELITGPILKLNEDKTEIIETYKCKEEVRKLLKICSKTLKKIIMNEEKHKNEYYITLSKCSEILLKNYNKPILQSYVGNSIKIKQINAETNQVCIFNSIADIRRKYIICNSTIISCIENKTEYKGFYWEYA